MKFVYSWRKFVPNDRSHEFMSRYEVTLQNYEVDSELRVENSDTHMITVTDQYGEIIGMSTGSDWLLENLESLRNSLKNACVFLQPSHPQHAIRVCEYKEDDGIDWTGIFWPACGNL